MIELAGGGKRGLELRGPLMLAAGGYGNEYASSTLAAADALVTGPVSRHPRAADRSERRLDEFPGGFLYDRRGANPGLAAILHSQRHLWRKLEIPLILTLSSHDLRHWEDMAGRLGQIEAVTALQLELIEECDAREVIAAVRAATDLPLLAQIPLEHLLDHAEDALEGGADVLVVGLSPRGLAVGSDPWEGRLGGFGVRPLSLRAVSEMAKRFPETPLVGAGGIHSAQDVLTFLDAGARAIEIDTAFWRDPSVVERIAAQRLADLEQKEQE